MKKSLFSICSAALLGVALASCGGSKQSQENTTTTTTPAPAESTTTAASAPIARGRAAAVQATLSVEAVDHDKRTITLKGPHGNEGTYEVGEHVERFSEIKAGDKLHAKYEVAALAELREPTEEEKSAPLVEVTTDPQRMWNGPPAAGIGRAVRAVTTIEALDRPGHSFTVKDPVEGMVTVQVDDPAIFDQLKIGQTIIVTFAETLALAVEPGAAK